MLQESRKERERERERGKDIVAVFERLAHRDVDQQTPRSATPSADTRVAIASDIPMSLACTHARTQARISLHRRHCFTIMDARS